MSESHWFRANEYAANRALYAKMCELFLREYRNLADHDEQAALARTDLKDGQVLIRDMTAWRICSIRDDDAHDQLFADLI